MERYVLQPSVDSPGWFVVTDTEIELVCKFKRCDFNNSQEYTFLRQPDIKKLGGADGLATKLREMSEWLSTFHYDLAMPDSVDDAISQLPITKGVTGVQVGAIIIPVAMTPRLKIGRQLKYYRQAAGLTVRELAELSGVNYANIAKIEQGKYNVSVDILAKIAKALGVNLGLR